MMRSKLNFRAVFLTLLVFVATNVLAQESANDSKTTAFASDDAISSAKVSMEAAGLRNAPSVAEGAIPKNTHVAAAPVFTPVAPAKVEKSKGFEKSYERNRRIWYGLAFASHGAAAFDAWSTNSAVDRGAQELNPLMRPVAGTGWIYPVAQLGPLGVDYLAHRMMRSNNPVLRKIWWVPQSLSAATSFAAGFHNMHVNR